jgi:hypothetical protein
MAVETALGAARPDSDTGRRAKRPDRASGRGLSSEPDDSVPDVGELR